MGWGAGNNYIFGEPTYQYCDDEVVSDGVSTRCSQVEHELVGSQPQLDPNRWRAEGDALPRNVIYEIDGKPATEVLNEYLPEGAPPTSATGPGMPTRLHSLPKPPAT